MKTHPRSWFRRQPRPTAVAARRRRNRTNPAIVSIEQLEERTLLTWTPLTNMAPAQISTMLLLSNGTVMAQFGTDQPSTTWYSLTPSNGSYQQGTWGTLAPMSLGRLFYPSNVLQDGRVLVAGGEDTSTGSGQNTGEIYNPVANSWSSIATFPQDAIADDPSDTLPNGSVLFGYDGGPQTYIYNPSNNAWTNGGTKLYGDLSDEETFLKLPDGSILTYDIWSSIGSGVATAQRYLPSTNSWVPAGTLPALLSTDFELGPAFLLQNGKGFFIGSNGKTALYTPSTNSWKAGPSMPDGGAAGDIPGAELPDGNVIFAGTVPGANALFEYNWQSNSITLLSTPPTLTSALNQQAPFVFRMLDLPSGRVLFTADSTQLWLYNESQNSNELAPAVKSITSNGNGVYTLSGTNLNGISEGAGYGDDAEMSTNYPIIELTTYSNSNFYFARTFNWSSTGVDVGRETVNFTLPTGIPNGNYVLTVIASGIGSQGTNFRVGSGTLVSGATGGPIATDTVPATSAAGSSVTPSAFGPNVALASPQLSAAAASAPAAAQVLNSVNGDLQPAAHVSASTPTEKPQALDAFYAAGPFPDLL
jgi:Kelch motif